jgi:coenzyme F420-reducing hydrogenase gamma subunit
VLAEGWRGGPQPTLSRFLKGCHVEDLSEANARAVGALAARAEHDDVVDVSVVEGAVRRRHAVVTSNPAHIRKAAFVAGADLAIYAV